MPQLHANGLMTQSFCHALYHLADDQSLQATMRAEVEAAVEKDGWTKNALNKMWKLDSFLKESMRYNGIGLSTFT